MYVKSLNWEQIFKRMNSLTTCVYFEIRTYLCNTVLCLLNPRTSAVRDTILLCKNEMCHLSLHEN